MILFLCFLILAPAEHIEYAVLYGNVESLGYYYVDLLVGTPAVPQTVIVDTGSRLTAFPCKGCTECGVHQNEYYDIYNSSTSFIVGCKQGYACSSCEKETCRYYHSYAEGSSISGYLVRDYVTIGDPKRHNDPVQFVFGCHSVETNLFKSQLADGIMGLARNDQNTNTLIDALYSIRDINTQVFSICLGKENGYMTVGGYNDTMHQGVVEFTPYYDQFFYAIEVEDIAVQDKRLRFKQEDFSTLYTVGTILDSGTTFVYLRDKIFKSVIRQYNEYCQKPGNCIGNRVYIKGESTDCFSYEDSSNLTQGGFFRSFPILTFYIGGITVDWLPENYLYAYSSSDSTYCIGIYNNHEGANVLGAIFMRGFDVVFDKEREMIGFAESNCDPRDLGLVKGELPLIRYEINEGMTPAQKLLIVLIVCIGIGVIVTVAGLVCKKEDRHVVLSSEDMEDAAEESIEDL